jgi:hypothetical protein
MALGILNLFMNSSPKTGRIIRVFMEVGLGLFRGLSTESSSLWTLKAVVIPRTALLSCQIKFNIHPTYIVIILFQIKPCFTSLASNRGWEIPAAFLRVVPKQLIVKAIRACIRSTLRKRLSRIARNLRVGCLKTRRYRRMKGTWKVGARFVINREIGWVTSNPFLVVPSGPCSRLYHS